MHVANSTAPDAAGLQSLLRLSIPCPLSCSSFPHAASQRQLPGAAPHLLPACPCAPPPRAQQANAATDAAALVLLLTSCPLARVLLPRAQQANAATDAAALVRLKDRLAQLEGILAAEQAAKAAAIQVGRVDAHSCRQARLGHAKGLCLAAEQAAKAAAIQVGGL